MPLSTRHKIHLASLAHRVVRAVRRACGRDMRGTFRRSSLVWNLDLDEGIDFAIWLLGAFEGSLIRYYARKIHPGSVVLDVGANVGAHTLHFARLVGPGGRVLAFEATQFACDKLSANLAANPAVNSRVVCHHAILVADAAQETESAIASSWPLAGSAIDDPVLGGAFKPVGNARPATLDSLLEESAVDRVDWMKIDVDGHEVDVLRGARHTLHTHRPLILLELAPYCFRDSATRFADLVQLFVEHDYRFVTIPREAPLPMDAATLERSIIPRDGSINVLAIPATPAASMSD